MSLLGRVGGPDYPLPSQPSSQAKSGSFFGRVANWIKRAWNQTDYVNVRMDRADEVFNALKNNPQYGGRLADLATPDLGPMFKSTKPFSVIASALREYADHAHQRASIVRALADDTDLDLNAGERDALAQRVRDEPRWGTPGNDLARLVNEHRADQLNRDGSLSAMVLDAIDRHGLSSQHFVPYRFVDDLRTNVIPGNQEPLTLEQAGQLALEKVEAFCQGKRECLDWVQGSGLKPYMKQALTELVNTDPGVRSTEDLKRVLNLANQMPGLVGTLLKNPTRTDQIKARDAFNQACIAEGLTQPAEQETFLARAFNTFLGSMGLSSKNADRYFPAMPRSLRNQHDELAREINSAKAQAQSEQGVAQDQPGIGLNRFLGCLADAAARYQTGGTTPTLSQHQSGSFSPSCTQAFQHELNKTLHLRLGAENMRGSGIEPHRPDRDVDQLRIPDSDDEQDQPAAENSEAAPNELPWLEDRDVDQQRPLQRPEDLGDDFNAQFLHDFDRMAEFKLGDRPDWPAPGQKSEKLQRFREFFRGDEAGKEAVTHMTNQSTISAAQTAVMTRLPDSPFQLQFGVARILDPGQDPNDPGNAGALDQNYNFPDKWEIEKIDRGGYRATFERKSHIRSLRDRFDNETTLDPKTSWFTLKGQFEVSGDSIQADRPCANVTSLTYDYQFSPKVGKET